MSQSLQTLLIASDAALAEEIEGTVREFPSEVRVVLHSALDHRRGIEHAIDRRPDLVLLELDDQPERTLATAREIATSAPELAVVVLYRPGEGSDPRGEGILIDLIRVGVVDFLRRPLSSTELEGLLRRRFLSAPRQSAQRGKILSFLGTKGGVGKSTVAINVACALNQQRDCDVLVVDASLQHGTVGELLDLVSTTSMLDAVHQIGRLDGLLLRSLASHHDSGLHVLTAPRNAIEAAEVDDTSLARVLSVARQTYDYVIVDTFPLLDPVTLAVLDLSDVVHVVLNDFVPTILGTVELLQVFDRLGIPRDRQRVILNQTHPRYRGQLPAADVAGRLDREIHHVVPFSRHVLAATNSGEPHVLGAPRWRGFPRSVRRIAADALAVRAGTAQEGRGGLELREAMAAEANGRVEDPAQ